MKKILVPAMLALLLFTAGCEQPPTEDSSTAPPTKPAQTNSDVKPENKPESPKSAPEPRDTVKPAENKPARNEKTEQTIKVKVYYPDDSGMKLVEVEREVLVDDSVDKYTAAVEALREEPDEENLTTIFPKKAVIRSVTVRNDLATVDFDGSILKGFVGGSTGEEFLIGSIVDTLTNFPEVKRVKFLVDGKEIETLSGHMDLSTPLERMTSLTE
ncbi:MAG: GerMN domain-containing protein [Selenomonadaceae bacterium]|nr:GerMN domain-containing protein [Selenomonadaceae bacterium]